MNRASAADALALGLAVPAAAVALIDGPREGAFHALVALAAAVVAWRVWRTPHPWAAALLAALAPMPLTGLEAAALAAALVGWALAPGLGPLLAVPFAPQALGHGALPWLFVAASAALLALPAFLPVRPAPPRAAHSIAVTQALPVVGAGLLLPAFTSGALHAAYAWGAFLLLLLAQPWASLLAWRAGAPALLAGPLSVAAAAIAALGVRALGFGRPDPFLGLAVMLAVPATVPVFALATRRLPAAVRGPAQGLMAVCLGLALGGLPADGHGF